jgi:hypothetical protein
MSMLSQRCNGMFKTYTRQFEWKAHNPYLKIWVLTTVATKINIFWDVTLCILEGSYQRFEGILRAEK